MTGKKGLWLFAAAGLMLTVGCGDTDPKTDGGTGCSTDSNCGIGKVCHPLLKQCLNSCTVSNDCPSSAKTCARFDGTAPSDGGVGFCQCATDALCSAATANQICSTATKLCENKCTSSSCPTGYSCDTASGQCKSGGAVDGGTDAGVDAGVTCNSSNAEPDVCGYGNVCTNINKCEPAAAATCANVSTHPAWTVNSTGPVIFSVTDEADVAADCAADAGVNPFTLTLAAYAGRKEDGGVNPFPTQKSDLPGFFYYTTTGTKVDIPLNLLKQSNYSLFSNNSVMTAKFTLCSTSTTSVVAGFGFTNGNPFCATLTR